MTGMVRERLMDVVRQYPLLAVVLVRSAWRLVRHRCWLREADHIVVMFAGGFGHTITGPDVMRRLYPGRRLVFIAFAGFANNHFVSLLWPDVCVLFLPFDWHLRVGQRTRGWNFGWDTRLRWGRRLIRWLKRFTPAEVISMWELYDRVAAIRPIESLVAQRFNSFWMAGWAPLLERDEVPKVRLPDPVREKIRSAIDRFVRRNAPAQDSYRLCCLYLRTKGSPDVLHDLRRSGGATENYVPAIRYLTEHGYMVLITGDRLLDRKLAEAFAYRLICGQWLDVNPKLFSLFANTEADIWIGQQAGPCVLPVINRIPMLVVDAFPFGNALPHAWMHYKTVYDQEGKLVHYSRLLSDYACDYAVPGLQDNSAGELLEAVKEFLRASQEPPGIIDGSHKVLASLPDHVQTKHVNCRLSKAWLRLFESEHIPALRPAGALEVTDPDGSPAVR